MELGRIREMPQQLRRHAEEECIRSGWISQLFLNAAEAIETLLVLLSNSSESRLIEFSEFDRFMRKKFSDFPRLLESDGWIERAWKQFCKYRQEVDQRELERFTDILFDLVSALHP